MQWRFLKCNGNIIFEDAAQSVGVLTEKPSQILIEGYPFRSIHLLPELGKTYAELNGSVEKVWP